MTTINNASMLESAHVFYAFIGKLQREVLLSGARLTGSTVILGLAYEPTHLIPVDHLLLLCVENTKAYLHVVEAGERHASKMLASVVFECTGIRITLNGFTSVNPNAEVMIHDLWFDEHKELEVETENFGDRYDANYGRALLHYLTVEFLSRIPNFPVDGGKEVHVYTDSERP